MSHPIEQEVFEKQLAALHHAAWRSRETARRLMLEGAEALLTDILVAVAELSDDQMFPRRRRAKHPRSSVRNSDPD